MISTPEHPDHEFNYEAYQKIDDEGRTYFIGPVHGRTMRQQLTDKVDNTHFIAIRYNEFKIFAELEDGSPNPAYEDLSADQRKEEDAKPSFWATWTRTEGLRYAVQYALLIVSEAAARLPETLREREPNIPWRDIIAIGNRLRHEYHRLDHHILWDVVACHVDPLQQSVRRLLAELGQGTSAI